MNRTVDSIILSMVMFLFLSFLAVTNGRTAQGDVATQLEQKKKELIKVTQEADRARSSLLSDHPGDHRSFLDVIKGDIEFEKKFGEKLKGAKSKAALSMPLLKRGVGVETATEKLSPFFSLDKKGNLYWGPAFQNFPSLFPHVAMKPDTAISFLNDLVKTNNKKLKERKTQLATLEKEEQLKNEVAKLEKQMAQAGSIRDIKCELLYIELPKSIFFINDKIELKATAIVDRKKVDVTDKVRWYLMKEGKKFEKCKSSFSLNEPGKYWVVAEYGKCRDKKELVVKKQSSIKDLRISAYVAKTEVREVMKGNFVTFHLEVIYEDGTIFQDPPGVIWRENGNKIDRGFTVGEAKIYTITAEYKRHQGTHQIKGVEWPENKTLGFDGQPARFVKEENKIITLLVRRFDSGKGSVTVHHSNKDQTAELGKDYTYSPDILRWEDGDKNDKPIHITIKDDNEKEANEDFEIVLSSPSQNYKLGNECIRVTILDDDKFGYLEFEVDKLKVAEGCKEVVLWVTLKGGKVGKAAVNFDLQDQSAESGKDYQLKGPSSKTLKWEAGSDLSQRIFITILDDKDSEGDETLLIVLNDTSGTKLGPKKTCLLTIEDDDAKAAEAQKAVFDPREYKADEGTGKVRVWVKRVGGKKGIFTVEYRTQDAYAQAGKDYIAKKGTLTWNDNDDQPKNFWVDIIDDQEPESREETIHLQLENPRNLDGFKVTIDEGVEAKILIKDNDKEPVEQRPPPAQRQRRCKHLNVTPQKAVARTGRPDTITFRAFAVFDDGSQQEITNDPQTTWKPGPTNTFTPQRGQLFTESVKIEADWQGCKGTAEITALTGPISRADQVDREAPPPPADSYTWYAFCDRKTGEVTYGEKPHPLKHIIMGGPFPGPRTVWLWINKNCPNWRCNSEGLCATAPALAPTGAGGWYVLCVKLTGAVTIGKGPDPMKHKVMAGPFLGEPDARNWIGTNCPNWRCTGEGACATSPARGGKWYVLCSKAHGGVQLGKDPDSTKFWIMSGPFLGEPDARSWVNANCPSWRCNRDGRCLPGISREMPGERPLEVPPDLIAIFEEREQRRNRDLTSRYDADSQLSYQQHDDTGGRYGYGQMVQELESTQNQMEQNEPDRDRWQNTSDGGSQEIPPQGHDEQKPTITPPLPPTSTPIGSTSEGTKETKETQSQGNEYVAYYVVPSVSWALEKTYVLDKSDFDKDTSKKEVLGTGATRKDAIRKACSKLQNIRSWRQSACSKVADYGDNTICIDGLDKCSY